MFSRILLIAGFLSSNFLLAQQPAFNLEYGYHRQNPELAGLNSFVDQYNSQRPDLSTPLSPFKQLDGSSFIIGGNFWSYFELGRIGRSAVSSAQIVNSGNLIQRDFKLSNHAFLMGVGVNIPGENIFAITPGARVEISQAKLYTRIDEVSIIDQIDWTEIDNGSFSQVSIFCKLVVGPVCFEPYYSFGGGGDFNLRNLNSTVNYGSIIAGPTDDMPLGQSGWGWRITFSTLALTYTEL